MRAATKGKLLLFFSFLASYARYCASRFRSPLFYRAVKIDKIYACAGIFYEQGRPSVEDYEERTLRKEEENILK